MSDLATVARIDTEGNVHFESSVLADIQPHQVLLQASFSALSAGTESALLAGKILPLPQTIGYAMAGTIKAVGTAVSHLKVGDQVVSTAAHANVQLIDAANVTKVPDGVDLSDACFFNLAHTALYAIRQSEIQAGQPLLIIGQGLVGQLITLFGQLVGAMPIVAIERNAERLGLAGFSGADIGVDAENAHALIPEILEELGIDGFPAVIEATGLREPLQNAVEWVGERGKVVMMSTTASEHGFQGLDTLMMKGASLVGGYVNSKPFSLSRRDLEIVAWPPSMASQTRPYQSKNEWTSDEDIKVFLNALCYGRIDLEHLKSHCFGWRELPEVYQTLASGNHDFMGVYFDWNS